MCTESKREHQPRLLHRLYTCMISSLDSIARASDALYVGYDSIHRYNPSAMLRKLGNHSPLTPPSRNQKMGSGSVRPQPHYDFRRIARNDSDIPLKNSGVCE
jgi:hypothetical protein